ncbi:MAG: outer membrane protein assembly factor BamA, partial [Calditrichaeota bacterium]|nr:outer membrane protein assembly factor BamA [Calditrichota bacterium]
MKFFLIILLCSISLSQTKKLTVRSIVVEGNLRTEASTIRVNSGLYIGKEITANDIQQAIKSLWNLNQWKQIQVFIKDIVDEKDVDLIIRVQEYPRLNSYVFKGADELDEDDLEKEINFYTGKVITPYSIYLARDMLLRAYTKEGYLLTQITTDTTMLSDNKVNIVFTIDEGPEVEVERIRIFGAEKLDPDDIVDAMDNTSENGFLGFGGTFEKKKYQEDLGLISKFIQNQGYRDGGVVTDSIYYSDDREDMFIDITVREGQRFYFGDVSFQGNTLFTNDEFMESFDLKKGEPYSEDKFNNARQVMREMYYNKGYLFAQASPRESISGVDTINYNFIIDEQNVVRINEIRITGNTKTQEKVIRRELYVFPGQKYSQDLLKRSFENLSVLNYFSNISPVPTPINSYEREKIDIVFDVAEKSTDQANASIGYSELDGLIGSIGLTFNNFSLENPFREGGGQQLSLNAQFGGVQTVYSLGLTEPWLYGTPTSLGVNFYYAKTRKDGGGRSTFQIVPYNEDRQSLSVTVGRRLKWPDNYFRASIGVQYERSLLSDVDPAFLNSTLARLQGIQFNTVSIPTVIQRDSRNSREFPTNGSLFSLSANYTFGEQNYIKNIFNVETYSNLVGTVVFMTNLKIGMLHRLENIETLLPNDLFHMGGSGLTYGSEPLRGYEDRSVGEPDVIQQSQGRFYSNGGDGLFKFTGELRFQLVPNPTVFGLVFAEAGNVWRSPGNIDPFNLKRSVGVGLRLFMPLVGIIGFD